MIVKQIVFLCDLEDLKFKISAPSLMSYKDFNLLKQLYFHA